MIAIDDTITIVLFIFSIVVLLNTITTKLLLKSLYNISKLFTNSKLTLNIKVTILYDFTILLFFRDQDI